MPNEMMMVVMRVAYRGSFQNMIIQKKKKKRCGTCSRMNCQGLGVGDHLELGGV